MEKFVGWLHRNAKQSLIALVLLSLGVSCGKKENAPVAETNSQSSASARWLAKREETRNAKQSAAQTQREFSEPEQYNTAQISTSDRKPSAGVAVIATNTPSKEDFARRLSAIVGFTITSDSDLRKKAEQGDAAAQRDLGRSIASTGNYEEAAHWYRKASDQGDAQAQHDLATLYVYGFGVPQDFSEAVKWFEKSAAQGNVESQYSLGLRYLKGDHVQQDFAEAAKWFRLAAEQGNADSQLSLARRYAAGEGVTKDPVEAYKWASLSDANGKWGASDVLAGLAATMTSEQIAEAKARIESFSAAAK